MEVRRFWVLVILLLGVATSAVADGWWLAPVNVVDPRSGDVAEGRAVQVTDGRITAIEPASALDADGARVIDGEGGWLIPGLAEMHAHVPSQDRGDAHVNDVLALFVANGVTTIRGMLGQPWHLQLRDELNSGDRLGPRLVTSGPSFNGNTVSSPEQGAGMVRVQAAAGFDLLKIHPGLSREEFLAIMAAANEADISVAGHVSFATGLDAALDAGMDSIDHLDAYAEAMVPESSPLHGVAPEWFGLNLGGAMDPSLAAGLAQRTAASGVAVVPTQSLFETTTGTESLESLTGREGMDMLTPALLEHWSESVRDIRGRADEATRTAFLSARRQLIAALDEAGAVILLGSDAPQIMNVPGFSVHQELVYMVDAGMSPRAALFSGTGAVADHMGEADRGDIATGEVADFILLAGNPLEDITQTTAIRGVARNGRWLDRATLDRMLDEVRTRGL